VSEISVNTLFILPCYQLQTSMLQHLLHAIIIKLKLVLHNPGQPPNTVSHFYDGRLYLIMVLGN